MVRERRYLKSIERGPASVPAQGRTSARFLFHTLVKPPVVGRWSPACPPAPRGSYKRVLTQSDRARLMVEGPYISPLGPFFSAVDSFGR